MWFALPESSSENFLNTEQSPSSILRRISASLNCDDSSTSVVQQPSFLGNKIRKRSKTVITEGDLGDLPISVARSTGDIFACYISAKIEAEKYLWSIVRGGNVPWDAVVLYPVGCCGPIAHPIKHFGTGTHSLDWGYGFLSGEWKDIPPVPMFHIADPRGVATAQLLALASSKASNLSIIIADSDCVYTHQVLANIIRETMAEMKDIVPVGTPEGLLPKGMKYFTISNAKSKEIFGEKLAYKHVDEAVKAYVLDVWKQMQKFKNEGEEYEGPLMDRTKS
jgi:hypothetical protein